MYNITKSWKSYRVYLPELNEWLKEVDASYCGMSAHSTLELHFTAEPTDEVKASIDAKWDSLDEAGEILKWGHAQDLAAAEADAREAVLTADWNDMLPAERKIAMNRPLLDTDREALLVKYPQ